MKLQSWVLHNGKVQDINTGKSINNGNVVTTTIVNLNLKPYQSCLWVGEREIS